MSAKKKYINAVRTVIIISVLTPVAVTLVFELALMRELVTVNTAVYYRIIKESTV